MRSQTPRSLAKVSNADVIKEILRVSVSAELDAIKLYEQLSALTKDEQVHLILLEIIREKKTYLERFRTIISEIPDGHGEQKKDGELKGKLLWNMC